MGPNTFPWDWQPSIVSIKGVRYEVANDIQIPNLGEHRLELCIDSVQKRVLLFQVCDVNKYRMSTAKLNEVGQRVVLDGHESCIEDRNTGERTTIEYNDMIYYLKVWVRSAFGGGVQAMSSFEKTAKPNGDNTEGEDLWGKLLSENNCKIETAQGFPGRG